MTLCLVRQGRAHQAQHFHPRHPFASRHGPRALLDGRSRRPRVEDGPAVVDFLQRPRRRTAVLERTEVRIVYTEVESYFGVVCASIILPLTPSDRAATPA